MKAAVVAAAVLAIAQAGQAAAQSTLTVSATTTPAGGPFAPRNIAAIWIEDADGQLVKTIGRWAGIRVDHLVAWAEASGVDADAIAGASRQSHAGAITAQWDLADRGGTVVPDGTYRIRLEVADGNALVATENNQATFMFVKGPASASQATATLEFPAVAIDYVVGSATCDNGVVEVGERCDPPGSCPTECAISADACVNIRLVGSAAGCTAHCEPQTVTACVSGDGCCAAGCDEATDTDCGDGGGDDAPSGGGGCAATPSAGPGAGPGAGAGAGAGLPLVVGLAIARRRRRRRAPRRDPG